MLPTPTMRRPSIRNCLIAVRCARVSAYSFPESKDVESGSIPRCASSGCAAASPGAHSTAPKRRGSRSRSMRSPRRRSKWSCFCAGVPRGSTRRLPDMPRCRRRCPSPQSTSRYFPRRRMVRTVRPASASTSRGTGQRRRGSRTATPLMTRPIICRAIPRRVTSTSGSSGMWKARLCGAPNIPKMGRIQMVRAIHRFVGAAALAVASGLAFSQADLSEPTLYDFLVGEIAVQRGDFSLAAKTYLDLAKRTRDPRVARRAVEVANQAREPELALEAARTWNEIEPGSAHALQVLAATLVAAKRIDEAGPVLEKLLSAEGVNRENGFMQLNRLLAGNPDKAANLRVIRGLAAKHAQLPQAHFAVAQAAAIAGDDAAAIAAVREAQKLRPDWELAVMLEAQTLQKRSPKEAAARLGQFVEKYPNSREVRLNYARLLVLDKRFAEARKQFEAVAAANAGNAEVVYAVGLLAFQLKDYPAAEGYLKRVLTLNYRDPEGVRYLLGQIAEEQKLWPQAIKWYESIDAGEHALPARMRTANAIAKQGKLDEARAFLQRVAGEHPGETAQLIVAEAQLLRDANRHRDAFELLSRALDKQPEQPDLLYDLALTAEKLERFDLLETHLRSLIRLKPDHAHAYNALGYSFADRNTNLPEARKLVEKALELAPEDYFIIDSMGWVLYREGDLKGAARELRRAYGGRPDAEIGAHLGEVLWVLGERDEARRVWEESLRSGPDNETLQKTIKRLRR